MDINPVFVFELLLFNGVILAWAGYEFWSVRKSKSEPPKDSGSAPPGEPGHPEG
jgi:hypothetical protein